jgi:dihydrofolate reductase
MILPDLFSELSLNGPAKTSGTWGGGELARAFLADDLINELHLGVVPMTLGEGLPLFPAGSPQRDFSLIENQTFS